MDFQLLMKPAHVIGSNKAAAVLPTDYFNGYKNLYEKYYKKFKRLFFITYMEYNFYCMIKLEDNTNPF